MANVFISYGHDLYEPIVSLLSDFLVQHGNIVFKDDAVNKKIIIDAPEIKGNYKYIRPTQRYDLEIDNAIQECDLVVSVISKHSTRPNGVCLDEIARAREFSKEILPLRVEKVRAPFLICRIQWVELIVTCDENGKISYSEENCKQVFDYILKIIKGEQKINDLGISELEAILTSEIFDFTKIIAEKTKNFVGREWLFEKLEKWVDESQENVFLITGNPGSGKTAFAARSTYITHICNYSNIASTDVYDTLGSLAYQLSNVIDGYAEQLMSLNEINKLRNKRINEVLYLLFVKSFEYISPPPKNIAVIIDAIDEIKKNQIIEFLSALTENKKMFPSWFKIILTSRPEAEIMSYFPDTDHVTRIDEDENTNDCIYYLKERLDELGVQYTDEDICRVVEYGESNFLYLYYLINEIQSKSIKKLNAEQVPRGINEYYAKTFNEIYGRNLDLYEVKTLPVFQVLCAAKGDIDRSEVAEILDIPQMQISNIANESHSFVDIKRDGKITFFHKTIKDWLTDFNLSARLYVDEKTGAKQIVRYMLNVFTEDPNNMSELQYIKKYGFVHIVELMETKLFIKLSEGRNQEILSCLYYSFRNISAHITARFVQRLYNIMSFQAFNKVFDSIMDTYLGNNMFGSVLEICDIMELSADTKVKILLQCTLCTTYRNMDNNKKAESVGKNALRLLEDTKKYDEFTRFILRAKVNQVNGEVNSYTTQFKKAKECFEKAQEALTHIVNNEKLFNLDNDVKINAYTWLIYCYGSLGYMYSKKDYDIATAMYKKEMYYADELVEIMPTLKTKLWLVYSYNDLAETSIVNYNFTEAKKYAEKSIRISKILAKEYPMMRTKRTLAIAYGLMGNVCRKTDDFNGCLENYQKGFEIILQLKNEFPSHKAKRDLALAYQKLSKLYNSPENTDCAIASISQSIDLFRELTETFPTERNKTGLAEAYMQKGIICNNFYSSSEAKSTFKLALEEFEKLEKEYDEIDFSSNISQLTQYLGGICYDEENYKESFEYYERYYLLSKEIEKRLKEPSVSVLMRRVYSCIALSRINFTLGNKYVGESLFTEAMQYLESLSSMFFCDMKLNDIFKNLKSDLIPIKEKINLLNILLKDIHTEELSENGVKHLKNILKYISTFNKFFE